MARACFVCGFRSESSVCPRCNTILRFDRAVCSTCGTAFDGWTATCTACGARMAPGRREYEDRDAVRVLASVPGISEDRARKLAAKGFRDFSDIVRLALPEAEVRHGLHRTIARRVMLSDLMRGAEKQVSGARCPMCGAAWIVDATRCAACGSSFDLELSAEIVEQKLQEITGEIVDLSADRDFRAMPEEVRNELLQAFGGVSQDDLLREEFRHQIDAWRKKGFDVEPVERLLRDDVTHFREISARLIRAQVLKTAESGKYRCPLCEIRLESTAEECGNCGARFS